MSALAHDSAEWLEMRRGGLGASDLPVVVGEDPYRSERDLALEKRGESAEREPTWPMRWGNLVQPLALQLYREMTGRKAQAWERTSRSGQYPHLYAHLDGKVVGQPIGVEAKWTRQWDTPPRHVVIQAQAQMGIAKLDAVDVIRLSPFGEPSITTIERDDDLICDLLELGEAWYVRYVLGPDLPPVDGSKATRSLLDASEGGPDMLATDEQAALMGALRQLRRDSKALKAEDARLVNAICDSMIGSYALVGSDFRVTWKPTKPYGTTDWKLVAKAYREVLDKAARLAGLEGDPTVEAIQSLYTSEAKSRRPFVPKWDESEEDASGDE